MLITNLFVFYYTPVGFVSQASVGGMELVARPQDFYVFRNDSAPGRRNSFLIPRLRLPGQILERVFAGINPQV